MAVKPNKNMKIYDCFNFFNELDILEMRLNILYDYVDYFVIVESSLTHSGEEKPFYYEDNKDRFTKFSDKIINYKVYDTPNDFTNIPSSSDEGFNKILGFINSPNNRWFNKLTQPDYGRDFFQKECVRRPLSSCSDDDIILFSDLDEIPNPSILSHIDTLDLDNNIYRLKQRMYYYYLNVLKDNNWYGTRLAKYKNIKDKSFNDIRGLNNLSSEIPNGGWHFSFMGGKEMVKTKLTSYSARDMVYDRVINSIEDNILNNIDPFFRGGQLTLVDIDDSYPEYVINNKEKYKHMIKL